MNAFARANLATAERELGRALMAFKEIASGMTLADHAQRVLDAQRLVERAYDAVERAVEVESATEAAE